MRTIKQLTNNKFLNIKEVIDQENNVKGYQFAERLGKDSIAFIGYDNDSKEFLVNQEYKPPIGTFLIGAFGGSIDKDKSLEQIVIDECKEEAGFVVTSKDVKYLGKVMVSTQMNQFCHLYLVLLNKDDQGERMPENAVEKMAKTHWIKYNDVLKLEDWKPITIVGLAKI